MNDRPTFSPVWHRVRLMKPRLRPHVQVSRQHYRGRRWHVVHDPSSNQFFRLNPVAYDFVGTLDGARDIESAWQLALTRFGDAAPTQNEIVQLISQLYNSNLLSVDATPETEQLLRRGRERLKRRAAAQAIGIMYFQIRLFNPDRLLTACEPVLRPLLNRWGFLAWCALVIYALASLIPHWHKLVSGFDSAMSPANLWLVPIVFVATKLWHEFGHGVICKRFGGQVPELGVMLLVLLPSPYVDASAAWSFPDKWKRIAVGAGGMMFELSLAAIAAIVWVWAHATGRSGELVTQVAYNIMLTGGISTVLFNANPLMRFDGYYMLADFMETPNLAQRSAQMLQHIFKKYIYRLPNLTPPTTLPGERAILVIYGLLSQAYRVFLFVTITLYVMGLLFGIGLVLALWTAVVWFVMPVGKFAHWLAASPQTADRRGRSVAISLALIALGVGAIGLLPLPDRRHTTGVVESARRTGVFAAADGFLTGAHRRIGERIQAGEPIATMESPELAQHRLGLLSQLAEYRAQQRAAVKDGDAAVAQIAGDRVRVVKENLAESERRIADLVVRAPHAGVVVSSDPGNRVGAYLKRGDPICEVVDPAALRIAATMDQRQGAWLFERAGALTGSGWGGAAAGSADFDVDVRMVSNVETVLHAARVSVVPAGQRTLPSAALGFTGGGQIETEGHDESGRTTKRPQFAVRIDPESPESLAAFATPGERVRVRFRLEPRPILSQWIDRLKAEVQGRVKL